MATRGNRSEKVKRIFQKFDDNCDGGLNRKEMAALVVAVNPRIKFSDDQITAILDEIHRTYARFFDGEKGLTCDGLLRTYEEGAGNVDRDFDVLELSLGGEKGTAEASSSSISDESCRKSTVTWRIFNGLKNLMKRLKSKQGKYEKLNGDDSVAYSELREGLLARVKE